MRSLSREHATEMAVDIIAVAKFYDLPLDIFLGIGAMENNYEILVVERNGGEGLIAEQTEILRDPKKLTELAFEQGIGFIRMSAWGGTLCMFFSRTTHLLSERPPPPCSRTILTRTARKP